MNASVARIGAACRVGHRSAWLVGVLGLLGVALGAALATRLGMLPAALAIVIVALVTAVSLRWPLLPLIAFAVLIPIEEAVVIDGLGTISRLAGIMFAVTYGLPRLGRLSFEAIPIAAWAYVAWAVVSFGWAIDGGTAWAQLQTLLQLFLIAVLVADFVVQRPVVVRSILWAYSLSAAVTALIGIQAFVATGTADVRAAAIQNQNPAQFAAVLLPAIIFGFYEVINRRKRLLGGVIALATAAGIVVSGTRGAWVSLALVALLFILPRLQPRRQFVAIATMLVVVVLTFQLPGVSALVDERTQTAIPSGGAGRTDIWTVAGAIYGSAPVLGVGYANFPVAFTQDVARASDISSYAPGEIEGRAPHNLVIGTLIELGPIGLCLLALLLIPLTLRRGWGPDAATVQAALATLVTMSLFLDIFANRKQVWLILGLAMGLAYLARRKAPKLPVSEPGLPHAGGRPT